MNSIINRRTIVSSKVFSSKVVSCLFAGAVALHLMGPAIAKSSPSLALLVSMLEMGIWLSLVLLGVAWLVKTIASTLAGVWSRVWTRVRRHLPGTKAQPREACASREQLDHLRTNVQRLGLAIYGITPEMEHSRRTHFQMLGEPVPVLRLQALTPPRGHEVLAAEFTCLVNVLNHAGFPDLERVRLSQETLRFLQTWGCALDTRLQTMQQQMQHEQQSAQSALAAAVQAHQQLGKASPLVQSHMDYHQIQGTLQVLTQLSQREDCPWALIEDRVQAITRWMQTVQEDLQ